MWIGVVIYGVLTIDSPRYSDMLCTSVLFGRWGIMLTTAVYGPPSNVARAKAESTWGHAHGHRDVTVSYTHDDTPQEVSLGHEKINDAGSEEKREQINDKQEKRARRKRNDSADIVNRHGRAYGITNE